MSPAYHHDYWYGVLRKSPKGSGRNAWMRTRLVAVVMVALLQAGMVYWVAGGIGGLAMAIAGGSALLTTALS